MDVAVIGDVDTVTGFRLAGVNAAFPVADAEQARAKLQELSQDDTKAIIIITEKLAEAIRDTIDEIEGSKRKISPIIVEIPDREGKIEREVDPLRELIKRAIGVEM